MTPANPANPASTAPAVSPAGVRLSSLAWMMLAAILCSDALVAGVMAQQSWTNGAPDLLATSVKATLPVLIGAAAGFGLFAVTAGRTPASAPLGLLAGSTVRMLVALSIALVLFFTAGFDKPTGTVFWVVFLACGLAAIVAETAWGMKNLGRFTVAQTSTGPSLAPAETH